MKLIIDTSKNTKVTLGRYREESEERAQEILPLLQALLAKNSLSLSAISEIEVITDPGSFTGTRVTLTISNMLTYLLEF